MITDIDKQDIAKEEEADGNFAKIREQIASAEVVLFMKGDRETPRCGFSALSTEILSLCAVDYHSVDVLADLELKESLKEYSDWPTIPQLYVAGELVGGCDIMREMYDNGELQELFSAKGIATASSQ